MRRPGTISRSLAPRRSVPKNPVTRTSGVDGISTREILRGRQSATGRLGSKVVTVIKAALRLDDSARIRAYNKGVTGRFYAAAASRYGKAIARETVNSMPVSARRLDVRDIEGAIVRSFNAFQKRNRVSFESNPVAEVREFHQEFNEDNRYAVQGTLIGKLESLGDVDIGLLKVKGGELIGIRYDLNKNPAAQFTAEQKMAKDQTRSLGKQLTPFTSVAQPMADYGVKLSVHDRDKVHHISVEKNPLRLQFITEGDGVSVVKKVSLKAEKTSQRWVETLDGVRAFLKEQGVDPETTEAMAKSVDGSLGKQVFMGTVARSTQMPLKPVGPDARQHVSVTLKRGTDNGQVTGFSSTVKSEFYAASVGQQVKKDVQPTEVSLKSLPQGYFDMEDEDIGAVGSHWGGRAEVTVDIDRDEDGQYSARSSVTVTGDAMTRAALDPGFAEPAT